MELQKNISDFGLHEEIAKSTYSLYIDLPKSMLLLCVDGGLFLSFSLHQRVRGEKGQS